ncbi:guanylate kinase [Veillonella montpellierensis DNF00314]|uniref:Guanylate kinase n=1 Tax=Veillonella montpellierensis DNF00314 TaxID=1401067 RepID=A0A096ALD6_9FIRM|nr:guanylate kinase [Veillonella montpellierensis]KGF47466.1 guanylate kinase [Veillonella montpellierensis DNF00314]
MKERGLLIVISGPSGAGKGTICSELRKEMPNLVYSVSMTTRDPRVGEKEGINYFFRTKEQFEELLAQGDFLEYAKVYDNYYGTPKAHVMDLLDEGKHVILEIDIQGAMQVKDAFSDGVFIYIVPPSLSVLSNRLNGRGTDAQDVINKRLSLASSELALAHRYDYIVVNDILDEAVEKVASILRAEACKISRNKEKIQDIYKQYMTKE